jgi:fermentation-respiration switch protein FrsA (DUF1100 family)
MAIDREDVGFTSHGATLRGWLYRAGGDGKAPGVVMAHGLTAVREQYLDRYAEVFAAAGITTLVYDHHGFGASDGEPRQSPAVSVQLEGYRDAVAWLAGRPSVDGDRIGLWGSSYSGGEVVLLAAEDLPVRCAVAQVPFLGGAGPELSAATLAAITAAVEGGRLDDTVPAVSATPDGLGIMYHDDAHRWFTSSAAERAPSWRNEIRIGALLETFNPLDHLAEVRVPLLLIVAPDDTLTPPADGVAGAEPLPSVEVVTIPGGHFDAYLEGFAASSGAAVAFFTTHLAG